MLFERDFITSSARNEEDNAFELGVKAGKKEAEKQRKKEEKREERKHRLEVEDMDDK